MPTIRRAKKRRSPRVAVLHENPAVEGRTGKLSTGTFTLVVGADVEVKFHTLGAVGHVLERTPARVFQLIKSGRLKGQRWGRDLFVLDQDLRQYLRDQRSKLQDRYRAYLSA